MLATELLALEGALALEALASFRPTAPLALDVVDLHRHDIGDSGGLERLLRPYEAQNRTSHSRVAVAILRGTIRQRLADDCRSPAQHCGYAMIVVKGATALTNVPLDLEFPIQNPALELAHGARGPTCWRKQLDQHSLVSTWYTGLVLVGQHVPQKESVIARAQHRETPCFATHHLNQDVEQHAGLNLLSWTQVNQLRHIVTRHCSEVVKPLHVENYPGVALELEPPFVPVDLVAREAITLRQASGIPPQRRAHRDQSQRKCVRNVGVTPPADQRRASPRSRPSLSWPSLMWASLHQLGDAEPAAARSRGVTGDLSPLP